MPEAEAFAVLTEAIGGGIRFFDTAMSYGESEARLGSFDLARRAEGVEVSTKIPATTHEIWMHEEPYRRFVDCSLAASLKKLHLPKLKLLQFHQCQTDFLSTKHVGQIMGELIERGVCEQVGVSVYKPEEAAAALAIPAVTSLQIPVNLLDLRFINAPWAPDARRSGLRLIGRSLLLQGVLVQDAALPPVKRQAELAELRRILLEDVAKVGGTLREFALRFVFGNLADQLAIGLLGVDSRRALRDNLDFLGSGLRPLDQQELSSLDRARDYAGERGLINPTLWNA